MIFIQNEKQLRSLLPNIQMTVVGETSVFVKMLPFLEAAERALLIETNPLDGVPDDAVKDIEKICSAVVAFHAMASAARSLDCLLTPNGFAVVFNQNLLPSAKIGRHNPVGKLIEAMKYECVRGKAMLVHGLLNFETWRHTPAGLYFSAIPFSPLDAPEGIAYNEWYSRMIAATAVLFNNYLDASTRRPLIEAAFGAGSEELRRASVVIKNAILQIDRGAPFNVIAALLYSVEQVIAEEIGVAKHDHKPFENKKNSHGYFF